MRVLIATDAWHPQVNGVVRTLTSLAKVENEQKAIACGFDDFEEKLDHDRLKRKVLYWLQRSMEMRVRQ